MNLCAYCQRTIQSTRLDPIISAKSLGWKNYHSSCAISQWARKSKLKSELNQKPVPVLHKEVESHECKEPMADKTRFYVQCTMMTDGEPSSDWHFIADTLEEAEAICKKQMEPSDEFLVLGINFECNKTAAKYVNCTIILLLKNGKRTVIDERTHPLQSTLSRKRSTEEQSVG